MGASWAGGESVDDRILSLLNSLPEPQHHGEARGGVGDNGETDVFSCRMGWLACNGIEVAWLASQGEEPLPRCYIPERQGNGQDTHSFTALAVVKTGWWRRYSCWYLNSKGWSHFGNVRMFGKLNHSVIRENVQKSLAEGVLAQEAA